MMIISVKCFNMLRMIKKIFIAICLLYKMFDVEISFYKLAYVAKCIKKWY